MEWRASLWKLWTNTGSLRDPTLSFRKAVDENQCRDRQGLMTTLACTEVAITLEMRGRQHLEKGEMHNGGGGTNKAVMGWTHDRENIYPRS
jgi:hypothetical protein